MNQRFRFRPFKLSVQLAIGFALLAVLSAAAVGAPAIWLIRSQFERQAWALVEQASGATQALLEARQSHLDNLAILTAQRPTLKSLLAEQDDARLAAYLETLREGAALDLIVLCDVEQQAMAWSGAGAPEGICLPTPPGEPFIDRSQEPPLIWLVGRQDLSNDVAIPGSVLTGQALNSQLARQLQSQTGLEQVFLLDGQVVASSFEAGELSPLAAEEEPGRARFSWGGSPYLAHRASFGTTGLETAAAMPVAEWLQAQQQLTRTMAAGMLAVMLVGSALGFLLARRVSLPLSRLASAATKFRKGDLTTPVPRLQRVREVDRVAYALEEARVALQHTLTQLRDEKAWIEHLLESIVEGIVTLDGYGRVTYFSQGAERITGWSAGKVVGKNCDEVFQPVDAGVRFQDLIPPPGRAQKVTVALRSGRQVTLAVTGARLAPPEAGKARVALVLRDVTDEEAVHRLLADFLANISHEFRTPLSALAASIELLLDQLPDLTPDELHELLNSLYLGTLNLQTLIDNLLEGASIETGRFRVYPRPADLGSMLDEAERSMGPLLDKYGQRLRLELPEALPEVQADPRRTVQVLVNLISNAVKHNPPEGEIHLIVEPDERGVKVSVADQGPGIPPEHLPDLFRRFVHLDSGSERAGHGAGLGLSVVKAIVEAQGGAVGAENCPQGGAKFWFTLPVHTPAEADHEADGDVQGRRKLR